MQPNEHAIAGITWYLAEIGNGEYDTGISINTPGLTSGYFSTPSITPTEGSRIIIASIGSASDAGDERTITNWTNDFTEVADVYVDNGSDGPMQGVAVLEIDSNGASSYSTTGTYSTNGLMSCSAIIASFVTTTHTDTQTIPGGDIPELYLLPTTGNFNTGDNIDVVVRAHCLDKAVNVVQANFFYPEDKLQFVSIDTSSSLFDSSIQRVGTSGEVKIGSGILGGEATGDQLIATVRFTAIGAGDIELTFNDHVNQGSTIVERSTGANICQRMSGTNYEII